MGVAEARARAREESALAISEHVQEWLRDPLPSREALRDEMLAVLRGLAKAEGVPIEPKDRIAAASRVLAATDQDPDAVDALLDRAQGDPAAALEWLERMAERLRGRMAAKTLERKAT